MHKAKINEHGAILVGKNVVCDAHDRKPIRIVTHAHSDHLLGLEKSIAECKLVLATPETKGLIGAIKGGKYLASIKSLNYKSSIEYEGEKITFYPANHIIGSCQVLIEDSEGTRIIYTGDFKLPNAEIIQSDILVIEATYGNPNNIRPFKNTIEDEFINLVKRSLKEDSVYIFGYHGKLQEIIKILKEADINTPIIVPEKTYEVVKVCNEYGMELKNCYLSKSEEGRQIQKDGVFIGVYHVGSSKWVGRKAIRIFLSGFEFDVPYKKIGEHEYLVALSDHADFEQLLEYVAYSKPGLVITDNYRVGDAKALAYEIKYRLKIEAIPMP
ncbi:MAG: MBL fold metallo-hydrolase [bacterium]